MFGRRPDATLATDLHPIRRFMPFISPRRNDSLVYFEHDVRVDRAQAFLEARNRERPDDGQMTLFHLVLRALTLVLHERPRLNRFTAGGRIWQRDGIWISFSAKKRMDDDAPLTTVKRRMDPDASLDEMVDDLLGGIREGKSDRKTTADHEMGLLLRLPSPVVHLLMRAVRLVDGLGLLPLSMIRPDPMYASAFVANLGSVGLEAGYHHLWEHGNCPLFGVLGRVKQDADGTPIATLKWSYDERVEDGLYCARGVDRLRELIENPEKL